VIGYAELGLEEIDERITDEIVSINADPTQIHQVIVNLATNASHAMDEEGGVMTVGIDRVALDNGLAGELPDLAPGEYARLTVSDTGTGISRGNMTGDRLARKISRIRPDIPIILCTGFSEKMQRVRSAGRPFDRCLMKPIDSWTMASVIRQA